MKTLTVFTEAHLVSYQGKIYAEDSTRGYDFWKGYLSSFDLIKVVARVRSDKAGNGNLKKLVAVEGEGVVCLPVVNFKGYSLLNLNCISKVVFQINKAVKGADCILFRIPGNLSFLAFLLNKYHRINYGVEVVGDPDVVFSKGVTNVRFRAFIRLLLKKLMKMCCDDSSVSLAVTENYFQNKYNLKKAYYASDVVIRNEDILVKPRDINSKKLRLISIGSMNQPYKGFDFLLSSFKELDLDYDFSLTIVGDGDGLDQLSDGLTNKVRFTGRVAKRQQLNSLLDESDLFVLASRTEGLPKVILEAQARGLPCLCTNVGGVPEILPMEQMFEVDDFLDFKEKLVKLIDSDNYIRASSNNLTKVRRFEFNKLKKNRDAFIKELSSYA